MDRSDLVASPSRSAAYGARALDRLQSPGWNAIRLSIWQLGHTAMYLLPPVLLVSAGFLLFSSTGRDDAHISYWPAFTLSRYGEIWNYNGQRVEQSSSLLQVLLLALFGRISPDLVTLGKMSSIVFGVLSVVAVYRLARRINSRAAFPSGILVATTAPFIYWSFSGMESTLAAFTALLLILAYGEFLTTPGSIRLPFVWAVGATILFELVRPETTLVLACILVAALIVVYIRDLGSENKILEQRRILTLRMLVLFGICLTVAVSIFLFRLVYFQSLFPQPVIAKSTGFSFAAIETGVGYLRRNLFNFHGNPPNSIISILIACSTLYLAWKLFETKSKNVYTLLSLLLFATYVSFVVFSGGDWMEEARFLVPILPLAMIFISFTLLDLLRSRKLVALAILLFLTLQTWTLGFATLESNGMPAWARLGLPSEYEFSSYSWFERTNKDNLTDIPAIHWLNITVERLLERRGGTVSILSPQMGMIMYHMTSRFFGRVQLFDPAGLTDKTFTSCQVASSVAKGSLGLNYTYELLDESNPLRACLPVEPDLIVDLYRKSYITSLSSHGYSLIYLQFGLLQPKSNLFPVEPFTSEDFIAVRNDLLPTLEGLVPVQLNLSGFRQ